MRRNEKEINAGVFTIGRAERFAAIFAVSLVAILSSSALAYETRLIDDCSVALHWPAGEEIPFWLNQNGCGDDLPLASCEAAIQVAFDTIENIDCTGVRFKYMGTTTANIYRHNPIDTADNINLIIWYESWPPDSNTSDIAIATSWTLRNYLGEFVEFGIALNGATYKWADDLSSDALDVQGVITAQILFILGLRSIDSDESILDGVYAYGSDQKRTPLQEDIDGVCYLAPRDPEPDHWNVGCPADQHCEAAKCVPGAPPLEDAGTTNASDSGTPTTSSDAGNDSSPDAKVEPTIDATIRRDATSRPDTASEATTGGTLGITERDGGRRAECQFNSDCGDDRICTDGKCVDPENGTGNGNGNGDGCGCRIGRAGASVSPIIPLLLLVACARILRKRISHL